MSFCENRTFRDLGTCQKHLRNMSDYTSVQKELVSFTQEYNSGCQWDSFYGFWFRAVCDTKSDSLTVTAYTDATCRQRLKRNKASALSAVYPNLGSCSFHAFRDGNVTQSGYRLQYCRK